MTAPPIRVTISALGRTVTVEEPATVPVADVVAECLKVWLHTRPPSMSKPAQPAAAGVD